jgi:8-hydroxy-5-deazaflavin:NADPH oxidoreductase
MRLGIIGAGHAGGTLGRLWEAQGHDVRFGVRDPATHTAGGGLPFARTGTVGDVAAFADVIVFATPWEATQDAVRAAGTLTGKTVVDCTNPLLPDLSGLAVGHTTSAAEEIAKWIPSAKVVKCFNTLGAVNFADPVIAGEKASMFYCGDDLLAKRTVSELGEQLGMDMVDAGPLSQARYLEPMAMLWILMATKFGGTPRSAFRLLR